MIRLTRSALIPAALPLIFLLAGTTEAPAQDEWDRAAEAVVRLEPDSFPEMPADVRAELQHLGCTIPQAWYPEEPHNVVRGRFARADQEDWAVLCSRYGQSQIRVLWGGPARCPARVSSDSRGTGMADDRSWLQGIGGGRIGYSRSLGVVGEDYIRRMQEAFGGPDPPPITHDALVERFLEKASTVWYCHQGEWLQLTGMD